MVSFQTSLFCMFFYCLRVSFLLLFQIGGCLKEMLWSIWYIAFKHPIAICWPLFHICFCWMKPRYFIVGFFPWCLGDHGQFEVNINSPLNIQGHWVMFYNLVTLTTMMYWFKNNLQHVHAIWKINLVNMFWNLLNMLTTL